MRNARETSITIALPTSILSIEHSLLLKSIRIHQVARWSSIFGVKEVVFYREPSTTPEEFREHQTLISDHWSYFFTPPYLRRRLIPRTRSLRYVGVLPPIRLNVFNVGRKPVQGEIRIGYVFRDEDGSLRALIGDSSTYLVQGACRTGLLPLRIIDIERRIVEVYDKEVYRGPSIQFANSLRETVASIRGRVDYLIATDRDGEIVSDAPVRILRGRRVGILFGSPKYGLFEISSQEGFDLRRYVDYNWNTIPNQEVVTVRTEEALIVTLGVINAFLRGE